MENKVIQYLLSLGFELSPCNIPLNSKEDFKSDLYQAIRKYRKDYSYSLIEYILLSLHLVEINLFGLFCVVKYLGYLGGRLYLKLN
jgi:hypothetical protein